MVAKPSIAVSSLMVTFFAGWMNGLTESAISVFLAGMGVDAVPIALIEIRLVDCQRSSS
ncbi:hypothetical protein PS708_05179 [Pseudomonas fluorescens]|nr:hypothetical protein PS708_05179 [Pseudomonas fluorescens]